MPKSLSVGIGWVETFNVGTDTGTSVDAKDYRLPFPFTGKIEKVRFDLGPDDLTDKEREMIFGTLRSKQ